MTEWFYGIITILTQIDLQLSQTYLIKKLDESMILQEQNSATSLINAEVDTLQRVIFLHSPSSKRFLAARRVLGIWENYCKWKKSGVIFRRQSWLNIFSAQFQWFNFDYWTWITDIGDGRVNWKDWRTSLEFLFGTKCF